MQDIEVQSILQRKQHPPQRDHQHYRDPRLRQQQQQFAERFKPIPKRVPERQQHQGEGSSSKPRKKRKTKIAEASLFIDPAASSSEQQQQGSLRERILHQTGAYLEMARESLQQQGGNKKGSSATPSVKSFGDRSMDEMSIHDQVRRGLKFKRARSVSFPRISHRCF